MISTIMLLTSGLAALVYMYMTKDSLERYLVFIAIYCMLLSIYFKVNQ